MNTILELLAGLLGKNAGDLSSLIDENGNLDESGRESIRVAFEEKFRRVRSEGAKEGHGRGLRESLEAKEKTIAEKYGVEVRPIEELLDMILTKEREAIKLDPSDVKKSEIYIKTVQDKDAAITKLKTEVDNLVKQNAYTAKESVVKRLVPDILEKSGYVIPESDVRRDKAFHMLYDDLLKGELDFKIDGDNLTPLKNGEPLQDDKFETMTFDDLVNSYALSIFDKSETPRRMSPGASGGGHNQDKRFSFAKPSSAEDALRYMDSIQDSAERAAYVEYMTSLEADGQLG